MIILHETYVFSSFQRISLPQGDPVAKLKEAKNDGRKVVYCSMGTVITGDAPEVGWEHRMKVENEPKGFTGKELCQAAWKGTIEAWGGQRRKNLRKNVVVSFPESIKSICFVGFLGFQKWYW